MLSKNNFLNTENLHKVTELYPYFPLGHFFLLEHYKKNNPLLFNRQAPLTALFFNNTNWLAWQLQLHSSKIIAEPTGEENKRSEKIEDVIQESISFADAEPVIDEDKSCLDEQSSEEEVDKLVDLKSTEPVFEETKTSFNEQLPKQGEEISEPVLLINNNDKEDLIAFEPLHTVDYFASQGIKLTDSPIADDKLGKQLKSFTEWLKSMKKIPAQKLPAGDEQTDRKIQNIAEASNADTEVATEAMAEVLVKQEKTEKAIELYEKLSLINPSKSAYFAAKIESLKTP